MNVNIGWVNPDDNCQWCPPTPGCPTPDSENAIYGTNTTEFITASPDVGIVLRTDEKAAKVKCGDFVHDLVYVDKAMRLQTISGVLVTVLCKVVKPQPPVKPGAKKPGCCPPPIPPQPMDLILPSVLVIDQSTEYDAKIVHIPIDAVRDFKADPVAPEDVRVWDVDFITDTQVAFYSKFEPVTVKWNGEVVEFTTMRGNVEGAKRYMITVNSMERLNYLTVVGTGNAIVNRSVAGIAPDVMDTFSADAVLAKVTAIVDTYWNQSENTTINLPVPTLYIPVLDHCYDINTIDLSFPEGYLWRYERGDVFSLNLGRETYSYQSFFTMSDDKLLVSAPFLLYVMYLMESHSVKMIVNGFDIDLPFERGVLWNEQNPVASINAFLDGNYDERDHCHIVNGGLCITRYDRTGGLAFTINDNPTGARLDPGLLLMEVCRESTGDDDKNAWAARVAGMALGETLDDPMKSWVIFPDYSADPVTEPSFAKYMYDIILPKVGFDILPITVDTKVPE